MYLLPEMKYIAYIIQNILQVNQHFIESIMWAKPNIYIDGDSNGINGVGMPKGIYE